MTDWMMPSEIATAIGEPGFKGPQALTQQKVGRVIRDLGFVDDPAVCRSVEKAIENSSTGRTYTQRYYDLEQVEGAIRDKLVEVWPKIQLRDDAIIPEYVNARETELADAAPTPPPEMHKYEKTWSNYQLAIFDEIKNGTGNVVVIARAGSGKCLGRGTPVLKYNGDVVSVEDIQSGDLLMGPDSKPRKVLKTNTGHGPLFRIDPIKGDSWVCNDAHVLTLAGTNREKGKVIDISLIDHMRKYELNGRYDRNWKLLRVGVEFGEEPLEISPYLVGLLLGDGAKGEPRLWNSNPTIISYCKNIAQAYGCTAHVTEIEKDNSFRIDFSRYTRSSMAEVPKSERINPIRSVAQECLHEGHKVIPRRYLINSETNRLMLLAGLLDTDGYLYRGGFELIIKSPIMAEQVLFLARSVGLAAYSSTKIGRIKRSGFEGEYRRITLSGDLDRIPTKVKIAEARRQVKRHLVTGFHPTSIGEGEFFGFTLDGDSRFLLGDFTVTHNTTTIIEGINYIPSGKRALLCAFNKDIQTEMESRAPRSVMVRTIHSLGFELCRANFGRKRGLGQKSPVDQFKVHKIVDDILRSPAGREKYKKLTTFVNRFTGMMVPGGDYKEAKKRIVKLVALCKNMLAIRQSERLKIYFEYQIGDSYQAELMCQCAGEVLKTNDEVTDTIDYDDMIYFPFRHNLSFGSMKFDFVMVDEAQDLNAAQLWFVQQLCATNGRIVALGDDRQSLYGFRGADKDAIPKLIEGLDAKTLPLSVSYRCPRAVVALAREVVPDIEWAPNASEGVIASCEFRDVLREARPGDFILSRLNAPLVGTCMSMLQANQPCIVAGKDIGASIESLVRRAKAGNINQLFEWLDSWLEKERKEAEERPEHYQNCIDKANVVRLLAHQAGSINGLIVKLNALFSDDTDDAKIVCSTVHKAKGMERNKVWMLQDTFKPKASVEEANIWYVSVTRAKSELYLCETPIDQIVAEVGGRLPKMFRRNS